MLARLIFLFTAALSLKAAALSLNSSQNERWLRYLQWEQRSSTFQVPEFFLSPNGRKNAGEEWTRSIEAFRNREHKKMGDEEMPVRCWLPARAELIEHLTGEHFPAEACPAVDQWTKAIGQERLSIIFASYYANNPASLFGHTFLRFSKFVKEDRSEKLLTYSAGFLALTNPSETQAMTMVKGLGGLYMGFYNVKPHYMDAALYNNSDSRDLWEYPLRLSPEEVRWASLYLWEMSHFGGTSYYFLDWNCAYRLLTFLEAVHPSANLSQQTDIFVLPADTIRILDREGLIDRPGISFEPSLKHRLTAKLNLMTPDQRAQFRAARKNQSELEKVSDVHVLDALIDYWTGRNYAEATKLKPNEQKLFDLTFEKRARISLSTAGDAPVTRPAIVPDEGHKTSWVEAKISDQEAYFSSRMGAHDLYSSSKGYDDFAAIDYFGLDAKWSSKYHDWREGQLLLADVDALNSWSFEQPVFSWKVSGSVRFERDPLMDFGELSPRWTSWLDVEGAAGLSFAMLENRALFFVLPGVRAAGGLQGVDSEAAFNIETGLRWEQGADGFLLKESRAFFTKGGAEDVVFRYSHWLNVNRAIFADYHHSKWPWTVSDDAISVGARLFY